MDTVAHFIANRLAEQGLRHPFLVTGGGAMFLDDAFGNHPEVTPVYCHHEQACAMSAEGYARITGRPGVAVLTTGPGGINALNGAFGAWTDSVPMLVLSGQVKRQTCMATYDLPCLRQLGDQEADIVAMARPITKYAVVVQNPDDIRYHLEKALYLTTHGRPGPVWLDIPIDVQSAKIQPEQLRSFDPTELDTPSSGASDISARSRWLLTELRQAKRPVIIAGTGVRAGNALAEFVRFAELLSAPVVTAWTHDLIDSDHPLYCSRPGTIGTRAGNFTVQNADLVLVLGSRLNIRQTSYNWASFASRAVKIQIDIDPAELAKPTLRPDHAICCDVKPLLAELNRQLEVSGHVPGQFADWLATCKDWTRRYPVVQPRQREWAGKINPYHFIETLSGLLEADDIVVCGNATACIVPFQVMQLKSGQRMFSNSGCASMGYDLPAAAGAYFGALQARGQQRRIVCLAGDGSIMMNLQELQTVAHYRSPLKILVLNNAGYLSIRTSQQNFFGRLAGAGPESGVSFPDFVRVATAFDLPTRRLDTPDFANPLREFLDAPGPGLCDVILDEKQGFEPRMSSRQLEDGRIVTPPLEDMFPFLERDELADNMRHSA